MIKIRLPPSLLFYILCHNLVQAVCTTQYYDNYRSLWNSVSTQNTQNNQWSHTYVQPWDHTATTCLTTENLPYKNTIHLVGNDIEIFQIMNEIQLNRNNNNINTVFYIIKNGRYHLLGYLPTTYEVLDKVLKKYSHFICVNNEDMERYCHVNCCWYVDKVINIPSRKDAEIYPGIYKGLRGNYVYNYGGFGSDDNGYINSKNNEGKDLINVLPQNGKSGDVFPVSNISSEENNLVCSPVDVKNDVEHLEFSNIKADGAILNTGDFNNNLINTGISTSLKETSSSLTFPVSFETAFSKNHHASALSSYQPGFQAKDSYIYNLDIAPDSANLNTNLFLTNGIYNNQPFAEPNSILNNNGKLSPYDEKLISLSQIKLSNDDNFPKTFTENTDPNIIQSSDGNINHIPVVSSPNSNYYGPQNLMFSSTKYNQFPEENTQLQSGLNINIGEKAFQEFPTQMHISPLAKKTNTDYNNDYYKGLNLQMKSVLYLPTVSNIQLKQTLYQNYPCQVSDVKTSMKSNNNEGTSNEIQNIGNLKVPLDKISMIISTGLYQKYPNDLQLLPSKDKIILNYNNNNPKDLNNIQSTKDLPTTSNIDIGKSFCQNHPSYVSIITAKDTNLNYNDEYNPYNDIKYDPSIKTCSNTLSPLNLHTNDGTLQKHSHEIKTSPVKTKSNLYSNENYGKKENYVENKALSDLSEISDIDIGQSQYQTYPCIINIRQEIETDALTNFNKIYDQNTNYDPKSSENLGTTKQTFLQPDSRLDNNLSPEPSFQVQKPSESIIFPKWPQQNDILVNNNERVNENILNDEEVLPSVIPSNINLLPEVSNRHNHLNLVNNYEAQTQTNPTVITEKDNYFSITNKLNQLRPDLNNIAEYKIPIPTYKQLENLNLYDKNTPILQNPNWTQNIRVHLKQGNSNNYPSAVKYIDNANYNAPCTINNENLPTDVTSNKEDFVQNNPSTNFDMPFKMGNMNENPFLQSYIKPTSNTHDLTYTNPEMIYNSKSLNDPTLSLPKASKSSSDAVLSNTYPYLNIGITSGGPETFPSLAKLLPNSFSVPKYGNNPLPKYGNILNVGISQPAISYTDPTIISFENPTKETQNNANGLKLESLKKDKGTNPDFSENNSQNPHLPSSDISNINFNQPEVLDKITEPKINSLSIENLVSDVNNIPYLTNQGDEDAGDNSNMNLAPNIKNIDNPVGNMDSYDNKYNPVQIDNDKNNPITKNSISDLVKDRDVLNTSPISNKIHPSQVFYPHLTNVNKNEIINEVVSYKITEDSEGTFTSYPSQVLFTELSSTQTNEPSDPKMLTFKVTNSGEVCNIPNQIYYPMQSNIKNKNAMNDNKINNNVYAIGKGVIDTYPSQIFNSKKCDNQNNQMPVDCSENNNIKLFKENPIDDEFVTDNKIHNEILNDKIVVTPKTIYDGNKIYNDINFDSDKNYNQIPRDDIFARFGTNPIPIHTQRNQILNDNNIADSNNNMNPNEVFYKSFVNTQKPTLNDNILSDNREEINNLDQNQDLHPCSLNTQNDNTENDINNIAPTKNEEFYRPITEIPNKETWNDEKTFNTADKILDSPKNANIAFNKSLSNLKSNIIPNVNTEANKDSDAMKYSKTLQSNSVKTQSAIPNNNAVVYKITANINGVSTSYPNQVFYSSLTKVQNKTPYIDMDNNNNEEVNNGLTNSYLNAVSNPPGDVLDNNNMSKVDYIGDSVSKHSEALPSQIPNKDPNLLITNQNNQIPNYNVALNNFIASNQATDIYASPLNNPKLTSTQNNGIVNDNIASNKETDVSKVTNKVFYPPLTNSQIYQKPIDNVIAYKIAEDAEGLSTFHQSQVFYSSLSNLMKNDISNNIPPPLFEDNKENNVLNPSEDITPLNTDKSNDRTVGEINSQPNQVFYPSLSNLQEGVAPNDYTNCYKITIDSNGVGNSYTSQINYKQNNEMLQDQAKLNNHFEYPNKIADSSNTLLNKINENDLIQNLKQITLAPSTIALNPTSVYQSSTIFDKPNNNFNNENLINSEASNLDVYNNLPINNRELYLGSNVANDNLPQTSEENNNINDLPNLQKSVSIPSDLLQRECVPNYETNTGIRFSNDLSVNLPSTIPKSLISMPSPPSYNNWQNNLDITNQNDKLTKYSQYGIIRQNNDSEETLNSLVKKLSDLEKSKNGESRSELNLGNACILNYMPSCNDNTFTVPTSDPNIYIKGWKSEIKIVRAKLIIETNVYSVNNFVPIIKGENVYDPETVQDIAKLAISERYGDPIVIKGFYKIYEPFAIVCNIDDDNLKCNGFNNILWPTCVL